MTGPGVTPAYKAQMRGIMNMAAGMSACFRPEMAAGEDMEQSLASPGGQSHCTVVSKVTSGGKIAFVTECKEAGRTVRVTADGTNSGTAQNIRMTIDQTGGASQVASW